MSRPVLRTQLCETLGIEYPIISAGMGPSLIGEKTGANVDLVCAVSEAGGLGVLGAAGYTVDEMRGAIREVKKRTDKPFGVDLLLPANIVAAGDRPIREESGPIKVSDMLKRLPQEHYNWFLEIKKKYNLPDVELTPKVNSTIGRPHASIQVCIDEKVPLFAAGLGNPGFMVKQAHAAGMKVLGITGNAKNAKRIADGGVDFLVAQGHEAGGHTGRVGTFALLPQAIDAAGGVPVLAAGGVGDGRGLAAALAMGCVGVWVGTRFLATQEGGITDQQKQLVVQATDEDTRRTYIHTGKTSRTIYNKIHDLWDESGLDPLPFGPQGTLASGVMACFAEAGMHEFTGPFSGQVSGMIKDIPPARKVVEEMVEQAVDILARKLPESITVKP